MSTLVTTTTITTYRLKIPAYANIPRIDWITAHDDAHCSAQVRYPVVSITLKREQFGGQIRVRSCAK